jgi:ABC-type transport system involved in cytochrome bd biosynthesis fused ATPase/permease subunit
MAPPHLRRRTQRAETERRLGAYDLGIESRRIIDGAMRGVFHSVGLGVAALGFGYLFTTAVSSMALDVTGLTAATMLLVTSFLILPYKRSRARNEFRDRIEELRGQIRASLGSESTTEIDRMIRGITGAFEPYERFYKSESQKVERYSASLTEIEQNAQAIGAAVSAL